MFFFSFVASCTYHSLVEILCGHRLSRTILTCCENAMHVLYSLLFLYVDA